MKVEFNRQALEDAARDDPQVQAAAAAKAARIAATARAIAPKGTGAFAAGIRPGPGQGRAIARVEATDPASWFIERGTSGARWGGSRPASRRTGATPEFGVLRRAGEANGPFEGGAA